MIDSSFIEHLPGAIERFTLNVGPYIVLHLVIIYLSFAYFYVWKAWTESFGGKRVSRREKTSPSNAQPPKIVPYEESKAEIIAAAESLGADSDGVRMMMKNTRRKTIKDAATKAAQKKAARIQTMTASGVEKMQTELTNRGTRKTITSSGALNQGSLSAEDAEGMDMDHVYLSFTQLLFAYTFVGANAGILAVVNTSLLRLRTWLYKRGIIKPKPVDYDALAARLCLESSLACYYKSKVDNEAGFFFPHLPYIDYDGKKKVCELLTVYVDVNTKKMTKATFDNDEITGSQVATILFFFNLSANHVKIHSMANWGLNSEVAVKNVNKFLYQNSLVTVAYNYFGFTGFGGWISMYKTMGLLSKEWNMEAWEQAVVQGVEDNIQAHPNIDELVPYSSFVNFIVKTRPIFLSDFAKYRTQFPGVHGEAMYIGTVMHSMDHTAADWACEEALWLDVDDSRFGLMAEMDRLVMVGHTKDLPGLIFHKRYKGSTHPFYAGFYQKAAKIDTRWADVMDTCIVK